MAEFERTLADLIPDLPAGAPAELVVSGISQDSREIVPGDLFCARSGGSFKGTDFITDALARGAVAVLVDVADAVPDLSVPVVAVTDLNRKLGEIAARFYGEPGRKLCMIGVTGTNGKTSCSHFLAQALNAAGRRTAVIGTVGNGFPESLEKATHTTPDAIGLQKLLARLVSQGAEAAVMEVSSHAVDQYRIAGIQFEVAAFTNLSRDHLDYHGSMEAYGEAKAKLFTEWQPAHSVIGVDDPFGQSLYQRLQGKQSVVGFGEKQGEIRCSSAEMARSGIRAQLQTPWGEVSLTTPVVGRFNLWNLMLTAGVLGVLGYERKQIESLVAGLQAVPGRMQCITAPDAPLVIVDYAHTPDALLKALEASRAHTGKSLYCVFGCGGDRDTGKRAEMGRIAAEHADRLIVTSDNPRTEDPARIISMIVDGVGAHPHLTVEPDRAAAIMAAVREAGADDVVLIAGKGHEDYQEINGVRLPFLDEQVARSGLEARVA